MINKKYTFTEEIAYSLGATAKRKDEANLPHQQEQWEANKNLFNSDINHFIEIWHEGWHKQYQRETNTNYSAEKRNEMFQRLLTLPIPLNEVTKEHIDWHNGWIYSRKGGGLFLAGFSSHIHDMTTLAEVFYEFGEDEFLSDANEGANFFLSQPGTAYASSLHKDGKYTISSEKNLTVAEIMVLGSNYEVIGDKF